MTAAANNQYRYAAELAQDANHAAEYGREIFESYSFQRDRMIEWDKILAPSRATVLVFVILFPVITMVEYLFSEELYRDVLPRFPWAMGLVFAVLAIVIAFRLFLGLQIISLRRKFNAAVRQNNKLTIDAVQEFIKAQELGYNIFENPVAKSIQQIYKPETKTEDSVRTIKAEFQKNGSLTKKAVNVDMDFDSHGPHTVLL